MASVEKRLSVPPAFLSSLKDVLKVRSVQAQRAGEECETEAVICPKSQQEEVCEATHAPSDKDERPCVLVTNDDGIEAPGLRALVEVLVAGGRCKVYVCAPDSDLRYREKSGAGHSITTFDTIAVTPFEIGSVDAYAVSGTPADCVSLSMSGLLFPWTKPALVISGINKGSNCGYHIIYSGTVAGAREAFICGVPSLSVSLNWKRGISNENDFRTAAEICLPLIHGALDHFPRGFFLNIDIPTNPACHKGFKLTRQGTSRLSVRWKSASIQRHVSAIGSGKEHKLKIQLAQLGRAASAVGAARLQNSPLKDTEIESTAGPGNGKNLNPQKTQYFRNEIGESEIGATNDENDFASLEQGYITVTPLGLVTHVEHEDYTKVACWISSMEKVKASAL